jgi:hypothetical protein
MASSSQAAQQDKIAYLEAAKAQLDALPHMVDALEGISLQRYSPIIHNAQCLAAVLSRSCQTAVTDRHAYARSIANLPFSKFIDVHPFEFDDTYEDTDEWGEVQQRVNDKCGAPIMSQVFKIPSRIFVINADDIPGGSQNLLWHSQFRVRTMASEEPGRNKARYGLYRYEYCEGRSYPDVTTRIFDYKTRLTEDMYLAFDNAHGRLRDSMQYYVQEYKIPATCHELFQGAERASHIHLAGNALEALCAEYKADLPEHLHQLMPPPLVLPGDMFQLLKKTEMLMPVSAERKPTYLGAIPCSCLMLYHPRVRLFDMLPMGCELGIVEPTPAPSVHSKGTVIYLVSRTPIQYKPVFLGDNTPLRSV